MPRWAHPPFTLLTLLPAVLLCLAPGAHAQQGSVATDKAALVALYNATDGPNWKTSTNWLSEAPLSTWHGVLLTTPSGRVRILSLHANRLHGPIPTEIANLTELELLNLTNNDLEGVLPTGLMNLTRLDTLWTGQVDLCAPRDPAFEAWLETIDFGGMLCPPQEQSVIDVAVFYTPAARDFAGGGAAEIESLIDSMVAETNLAYAASGVNQRLLLVEAREVAHTEADAPTDQERLVDKSDGVLDGVHAIRDEVAADVVMLLGDYDRGFADVMSFVSPGFEDSALGVASVTDVRWFAHELGHLMGLRHDRHLECHEGHCSRSSFEDAYGYVNQEAFEAGAPDSAGWYTIMAYGAQCVANGLDCEPVLRFSNPDRLWPPGDGEAMGIPGVEHTGAVRGPANAARALNRTRATVANFRTPTAVTVSFGAAAYTAAEGGEAATVTVNLSPAPGRPVSIPLLSVGATGATASDYTAPGSVAFAATETAQTFTVTAVDDDADDDGETVALEFDTSLLPSGMTVGNPATATVTLDDDDAVAGAPSVSMVALTTDPGPDAIYALGDEIEVTVSFSETVKVEGTPQLRLRVGSRTRTTGYLRGSGTAALVFGYEVAEGDEDTDGVSVNAGRISLNGGTIKDEADNPAVLAHGALAAQAGHQVDGVRPAFVSAAVDGSSLTLTYGEALDGGSRPASGDFTVEVEGAGRSVSGVSVSGRVVTLTLNPAVEQEDTGIRVSYAVPTGVGANPIRDAVGNHARGLNNQSVTNTTGAPNTAPEITSPGSFDVPENQALARRLAARDTDPGDEVTGWAIVGGADRSEFSIASDTGELSFREAPDYEGPGDNQYVVRVEVTSGAGARELEAEQTFTISVTDEREPPEVPEAPTFSGETADSLRVSWSEPDNTGPPISDYDVQYGEEGPGGFTGAPHQGPGRTLTLSDLKAGTLYQVQVRATNEEGTSGWSASGEGMTVTPLTVEMTSSTEPPVSGPFTVRFSFSEPVTGFTGSDIETQQDPACRDSANNTVFCDPVIGGLETTDDRVFTTTVTPQTDRVAHSYTLRLTVPGGAVRSLAGSKPNEEPEEPLEVRVSPPGSPEPISSIALGASSGSGSVRLSWNRPSDNGGSAIIRYEYRYAATGKAWSQWEQVGAGSSGVTVGGLIDGREYVFEVRAVNALGKGAVETTMAVPERRIAPPPPPGGGGGGGGLLFPPEAPAGLSAMPGDGTVRLEWGPPTSDGGSPILRYEYRLKEGRGEFGEWTPIPDSAVDEANAAGFTVMDLGNGTVYAIELRAVNAAGNGQALEAVEVRMPIDPAWWSNFRAEDLEGAQLRLEAFLSGGSSGDREVRFGEGLRFEEDELDGEGEVTATRMGSYGYRYTSRTTGRLPLDFDGGEACELRLTFSGEGAGSYVYRCGGTLVGQGSFQLSELVNRVPEITSTGPFEVEENRTRVAQLEAVDWDAEDEVTGYGIAGGADGGLFTVEAETGELSFRQAPDYENPGDVESEEPASPAGDNEYVVVVEVTSGEGERERSREQAIRVRVRDQEMEEEGEDEMGEEGTESLFVPVILSAAGRNQSFFTSELTLTNRGEQEARLDYTYTSRDDPGRRSGKASDVLPAGRQKIETDALTYLRGLGVPIPETGNQLGTLRVEVPPGSEVEAVVRTTTLVPDGRAGLAYPGVAEEEGFEEPVYLCGLRQNAQDRSNVAFQNMGTSEEGAITLKATVYSGEAGGADPRVLDEEELRPGEFHQYNRILNMAGFDNGYVKVERVEGEAPFYAYGVINDQANSDGSFVFPVTASSLEGAAGQTLPVIVETSAFRSELTVTNFSEEPRRLDFRFVADAIKTTDKTASFSMNLEAGEQRIIPEVVEELRRQGVAGLGATRGFYAGPLFVTAEGGDLSGIVIGARTGSKGGGGQYSVFYNAVPFGEAFSREAWVDGLQQNRENRSNLALVNTGEVDESPSVFHLEIYDGETGLLQETVVTKPVPARGWHQINGILGSYAPETRQGYVRIEKVSGENPFLAYGVVNDGGAPGERSGDGAYLPAR